MTDDIPYAPYLAPYGNGGCVTFRLGPLCVAVWVSPFGTAAFRRLAATAAHAERRCVRAKQAALKDGYMRARLTVPTTVLDAD
jgi:hypothetical protein